MSRSRHSIVNCIVTGHRAYGVLVRDPESGEGGYIDRSDIADSGLPQSEWPGEGSLIRCVVLGYTRDGRLRLSSRPRDVNLAEAVPDLTVALQSWVEARKAGESNEQYMRSFLRKPYALPVLRWAIRDRPNSENYKAARWAAEILPPEMRKEL